MSGDRYVRACLRCSVPLIGLTCPRGHVVLTAAQDHVWMVIEVESGRTVAPLVTENADHVVRWERWFEDRYGATSTNRDGSRRVPIRDRGARRKRPRLTVEGLLAAVDDAAKRLEHGVPLTVPAA